jgi:hypothetical protein
MTLKTVQAIRHIGLEDLGSFAIPLRAAGYDIEYVDVAERDAAQLDPLAADLLVVLGGPIGVYDDDAYPLVTDEIRLLRARLAADQPTLGICLGAQLMAAALAARVYPGPVKEIGWSELNLSDLAAAILSLRFATFRCFTGMATRLTCRRAALCLRPPCYARTRPSRVGPMCSACSSIRRSLARGSSTGFWVTPMSWPRQVSIPSRCAAMPRDMPAISKRPGPQC